MIQRIAPMFVAAACAIATLAPGGGAAARPAPQHVLSRGLTDHTDHADHANRARAQTMAATRKNERVLYGSIDAIHGNILLVRARNGRSQSVDASDAIRSGMFSAPLFVGKLILVNGYSDATHTLHAQSITRETRPDAAVTPDR